MDGGSEWGNKRPQQRQPTTYIISASMMVVAAHNSLPPLRSAAKLCTVKEVACVRAGESEALMRGA
jgi:hypothetical protein